MIDGIDYRALGQNIKHARLACGYKQKPAAKELGIGASYYSHIESGDTSVGLKTLIRIASLYGVTLDYLMYGPNQDAFAAALIQRTKDYSEEEKQYLTELLSSYDKLRRTK